MVGEERRERIRALLYSRSAPISASAIAREFSVTRQIIVSDIAILRAQGERIRAEHFGYVLERDADGLLKRVVCRHNEDDTSEEFYAVVDNGGKMLDVIVEHELYGPIRADLLIENREDAEDFVRRLASCRDNPLKVLTDDCHYHTVAAPSEKLLNLIEAELREKGYLETA